MAYRYDPDLEFLGTLKSEEMNDLVYLLTHDRDGSERLTGDLTIDEKYKRYYPDHIRYWQLVAEEIQRFGGNTFANLIRGGHGVLYKEVLCDVCDKMKVNYNKYSSTELIEQNLLMKILEITLDQMTPEELKNLSIDMKLENIKEFTPQAMSAAFIAIFRAGGFKSYQLTLIIVNAVMKALLGRGLTLAANAGLMRIAGILTGPIGIVITSIWTLIDLGGPAYRVTIPAVIQVAYLRSLAKFRDEIEKEEK